MHTIEKIQAFQSRGQKAVNTIYLGKIDQNIFLAIMIFIRGIINVQML